MATIQRFSTTTRGALYIVGNTLGLSGSNFQPASTDQTAIFITTNTSLPVPTGWSGIVNLANNENTTAQWQNNSATAILNLPSTSEILYAELIWPSCVSNASGNVTASQNVSITLTAPDGQTFTLPPDPTSSQSVTTSGITVNNRSAVVTSILQSKGNGSYTVGGVPAILGNTTTGQWAAWAFLIAYKDPTEDYRNLNIFLINDLVAPATPLADISVSGFLTPSIGPVNARILLAVAEGDSNFTGDSVRFGATTGSLQLLSGPRNPSNNFFQAQINNNLGLLDTTGSFGTRNQPLGSTASGVRQGFDITNVSGSNILPNNSSSAIFRFSTSVEGYAPAALGIQIDANSAKLVLNKVCDKDFATLGDTLTYTVSVRNSGTTTAFNITFIDTIPSSTLFIPNSVTVNNISQPSSNPEAPGFPLTDLAIGGVATITFKVLVTTLPTPSSTVTNQAVTDYFFVSVGTTPVISDASASNLTTTTITYAPLTVTKYVDKPFTSEGDILTYTLVLSNTGNTSATQVFLIDTISSAVSFIPNSLTQDASPLTGSPIPPGITLPNSIQAGGVSTVQFKVLVGTSLTPNPIPNEATVTHRFIVNPTLPTTSDFSLSSFSNSVFSTINTAPSLPITKRVNKAYATCGDTLTYAFDIPNTSSITATTVLFHDTIPANTTFVANSVYVNGIQQVGLDPGSGINLGTIAPGVLTTLSFSVVIVC